jgi:hypothetical protein
MPILETTGRSDPLGLWEPTPQIVSFGIGDEIFPEDAVPVFRVNLPESKEASSSALADYLASFERINAALDEVPSQLDGLVNRIQAKKQKASAGLSFDAPGTKPEAMSENSLENELLALLADSDAAALSGTGLENASFGVNALVSEALGQAKEKFEALLEQVNQDMLHFAWVETKIANLIIARTKVGWSGDSTTILNELTSAEQTSLHKQSLEVVARTRNLKLRMLLTISSGAAKVVVLMASPGGPMLALPAVSQYVMDILQQVKQIQSVQSSS